MVSTDLTVACCLGQSCFLCMYLILRAIIILLVFVLLLTAPFYLCAVSMTPCTLSVVLSSCCLVSSPPHVSYYAVHSTYLSASVSSIESSSLLGIHRFVSVRRSVTVSHRRSVYIARASVSGYVSSALGVSGASCCCCF